MTIVTIRQLVDLQVILQKFADTALPARTAFAVGCFARRLAPEMEAAKVGQLQIFERWGNKTDEGYQVPPEAMAEFQAEYVPYLATEVEIAGALLPDSILDVAPHLLAAEAAALEPFLKTV